MSNNNYRYVISDSLLCNNNVNIIIKRMVFGLHTCKLKQIIRRWVKRVYKKHWNSDNNYIELYEEGWLIIIVDTSEEINKLEQYLETNHPYFASRIKIDIWKLYGP